MKEGVLLCEHLKDANAFCLRLPRNKFKAILVWCQKEGLLCEGQTRIVPAFAGLDEFAFCLTESRQPSLLLLFGGIVVKTKCPRDMLFTPSSSSCLEVLSPQGRRRGLLPKRRHVLLRSGIVLYYRRYRKMLTINCNLYEPWCHETIVVQVALSFVAFRLESMVRGDVVMLLYTMFPCTFLVYGYWYGMVWYG
jgi:hypothetical protein